MSSQTRIRNKFQRTTFLKVSYVSHNRLIVLVQFRFVLPLKQALRNASLARKTTVEYSRVSLKEMRKKKEKIISLPTTAEIHHAVASLAVFTQDCLTHKSNRYAKKIWRYEINYHPLVKKEGKYYMWLFKQQKYFKHAINQKHSWEICHIATAHNTQLHLAFRQQADALTWKTGQQHLCFRPKQNSGGIQRPNIVKPLTANSTALCKALLGTQPADQSPPTSRTKHKRFQKAPSRRETCSQGSLT